MIVDCHVNVYEDAQIRPLLKYQTLSRAGGVDPCATPERVKASMTGFDRYIAFSLRYGDSTGIDGDDEVTARLVALDPGR